MKICRVCNLNKPYSDYHKSSSNAGGVSTRCKPCTSEAGKTYRALNKESITAKAKTKRIANPEAYKEVHRRYREKNADKIRERNKEWARLDYAKNPRRNIDSAQRWQRKNPDKVREIEAGRCKVKARIRANIRRKSISDAGGKFTAEDVRRIMRMQGSRCIYCKVDCSKTYHVDHIIPVSKGGSSWPENLQILCPRCNLSKSAKCPIAFAQERGMLI